MTPIGLVTGKTAPAIHLGPTAASIWAAVMPGGATAFIINGGPGLGLDAVVSVTTATDTYHPAFPVGEEPAAIVITHGLWRACASFRCPTLAETKREAIDLIGTSTEVLGKRKGAASTAALLDVVRCPHHRHDLHYGTGLFEQKTLI